MTEVLKGHKKQMTIWKVARGRINQKTPGKALPWIEIALTRTTGRRTGLAKIGQMKISAPAANQK